MRDCCCARWKQVRLRYIQGIIVTCRRDGEAESVSPRPSGVADDVHEQPVRTAPAIGRRDVEAEEDVVMEAEEIVHREEGEGWWAAKPEAVPITSGASANPVAVASGASEATVRLLRPDDVRVGE